jgi:superfamily I DNA/RNA helicase
VPANGCYAKGLDFAHVSIPDADELAVARRPGGSDDAYQEGRLLDHRQLYVALTRARDSVWLARLSPVNEDPDARQARRARALS